MNYRPKIFYLSVLGCINDSYTFLRTLKQQITRSKQFLRIYLSATDLLTTGV